MHVFLFFEVIILAGELGVDWGLHLLLKGSALALGILVGLHLVLGVLARNSC